MAIYSGFTHEWFECWVPYWDLKKARLAGDSGDSGGLFVQENTVEKTLRQPTSCTNKALTRHNARSQLETNRCPLFRCLKWSDSFQLWQLWQGTLLGSLQRPAKCIKMLLSHKLARELVGRWSNFRKSLCCFQWLDPQSLKAKSWFLQKTPIFQQDPQGFKNGLAKAFRDCRTCFGCFGCWCWEGMGIVPRHGTVSRLAHVSVVNTSILPDHALQDDFDPFLIVI